MKGHNSQINEHKTTDKNLNLDFVNMNTYIKSGEILTIVLKILSEILISIKIHNFCNLAKMMRIDPNVDVVNIHVMHI